MWFYQAVVEHVQQTTSASTVYNFVYTMVPKNNSTILHLDYHFDQLLCSANLVVQHNPNSSDDLVIYSSSSQTPIIGGYWSMSFYFVFVKFESSSVWSCPSSVWVNFANIKWVRWSLFSKYSISVISQIKVRRNFG